ncbi:hypothetical protein [Deinococcus maricopensis]|uniref:DUF8082 domain-containing protein n=1 Tax=Deinococcus maricopensis (strain DSM 21211 / LMG 22137 / NRRL B-23946 / LB-34) TaxID=709986 RepID=E8U7Q4_DEIML|nr:hypothetical protein [Deinococcus maricopensis]ADV67093.1 hypothetical protein Deima_1444 [Deinococcus maricopensis DSM 21211]
MTLTDYPNMPDGVTDDTALPFAMWRVIDQMNGKRSMDTIARSVAMSVPQVRDLIARAIQLATAANATANNANARLTDELIEEVSACLVATVGPMGELLVDEALDNVGDNGTLSEFLNELAGSLQPPARAAFAQRLRSKGLA